MLRNLIPFLISFGLAACTAQVGPSGEPSVSAGESALAASGDTFGYLIVTRQDTRRCAYPMCGGYFVKRVNQAYTRCADGVSRTECHVVDFDFTATGLSDDEANRFQNEVFGAGHGLVRGDLVTRNVGATALADTLNVREAWEGQALSSPKGAFMRLSDTGIACFAYPCNSIRGDTLNSSAHAKFAGVDFASSGASSEAITLAEAALDTEFVLAAGSASRVVGPAGRSAIFKTTEFYLRVLPKPSDSCVDTVLCIRGSHWSSTECKCVPGCETDADCTLAADYCTGCDCLALSAGQTVPECSGPGVRCFADPCMQKTAVCENQACVVR